MEVDSSGIGYLPRETFAEQFGIRVIRRGINDDVTHLCRLYSDGTLSTPTDGTVKAVSIHYGSFYIPSEIELGESEEYWANRVPAPSNARHFNTLVKEGKVRFDSVR